MTNKILLTGAGGNIGSPLRQALVDAGADLVVGSHSGAADGDRPSRTIDFADPAGLSQAFDGIDTLFLLVPLMPAETMREWTHNAVAAAREAGVRHIVRSSGGAAATDSPYALMAHQAALDAIVTDSGLPWTLIRPYSFMQNFATYLNDMVRGGTLYLPTGEGATAYVDTGDIAAVATAVLTDPQTYAGATLTVTGPESLDNHTAMARIGEALGRSLGYMPIDDDSARQAMAGQGMPDWAIDWMLSLYAATRDGALAEPTDTVERVTGRAPRTFAEFARDYAAAWQ